MPAGKSAVISTPESSERAANTRLIVRGSPIVSVTAGFSAARRDVGLRTDKPVNTTVSIVSANAPKNANAAMRCARVGFGRVAAAAGSAGGAVKAGPFRSFDRLLFEKDGVRRNLTANAPSKPKAAAECRVAKRRAA